MREGVNEAQTFWAVTRKGVIGRRFGVPSADAAGPFHRYKVVSKYQVGDEIHVGCEHVD
jgi:hypothetical protein